MRKRSDPANAHVSRRVLVGLKVVYLVVALWLAWASGLLPHLLAFGS